MLEDIEARVQESVDLEKVKQELLEGLNQNLTGNEDLKKEFDEYLDGRTFTPEFVGISIMILNSNGRKPYYLARLNLYAAGEKSEGNQLATYEIEYSMDGEILDDFLVF